MQRLHEWKENKLTLRDLTVSWLKNEARFKAATTYSNIRRYCKKSAAVIVSRKRALKRKIRKSHQRTKDQMLEWGNNPVIYGTGDHNRNSSANYLCEDKPEAESTT